MKHTPPRADPADAPAARQRRKAARPQELLDAALALFVDKGFAATRAEEVARRAGVSKGTLYVYYPSKDELFKAVVRQNLSSLIAEGEALAGQFEGSSSQLLTELVHKWWQRVGNTPAAGIHKVVLAEAGNFPELADFYTREVVLPAHRLFSRCVLRGVARGEFRPLPEQAVAQALMAPMIFMALCRHAFGAGLAEAGVDVDPSTVLATHLELVLRGLELRP